MPQNEQLADTAARNPATSSELDARYGRQRQRGFDRKFGFIAAGALILFGIAFLLFSGWQQGTNIEFSDLKYDVKSDTVVNIGYEVTAPTQAPVACALEALSTSFSTVGWKIIELPLSDERHRVFNEDILTTYPATTATVRHCWVIENPS